MATSIKCDVEGCKYTATHIRPGYAKCMIGRHKSMAHGIRGKLWKYSVAGQRELSGNSPVEASPIPPKVMTINTPNYCPNCGCNLRAVTVAMNLKGRQ